MGTHSEYPDNIKQHNNIFLIGLMGSGKTTVGKKLSGLLGFEFVDIDQELIQRTGVSISHIFELEGEDGFRERESRLLEELCQRSKTVISTGGGIVVRQENCEMMKSSGTVIYLDVPLSLLWSRLKDCRHRPLLQVPDPKEKLIQLMQERSPQYRNAAEINLPVAYDSAAKTARKIQQILSTV